MRLMRGVAFTVGGLLCGVAGSALCGLVCVAQRDAAAGVLTTLLFYAGLALPIVGAVAGLVAHFLTRRTPPGPPP